MSLRLIDPPAVYAHRVPVVRVDDEPQIDAIYITTALSEARDALDEARRQIGVWASGFGAPDGAALSAMVRAQRASLVLTSILEGEHGRLAWWRA